MNNKKIGLCIKDYEVEDLLNLCLKYKINTYHKEEFKNHHLYIIENNNIYYVSTIIMHNTKFDILLHSVSELEQYLAIEA